METKIHKLLGDLIKYTNDGNISWKQNSKDDSSFVLDMEFKYNFIGADEAKVEKIDKVRFLIAHDRAEQFKYIFTIQRDQRTVRLEVATVGTSIDKLITELFDSIIVRRAMLGLSLLEKNVPEGQMVSEDTNTTDDFDIIKLVNAEAEKGKTNKK